MNIVTAIARELKSHTSVTSLGTVGKHAVPGDVDGTGLVKLGIMLMGSWYATTQSARFPRVRIVIVADASRVGDQKTSENAHDRALEMYRAADEYLHRETREAVVWGGENGVMVLGSQRAAEPSFVERPDSSSAFLVGSYNMKIV